MAELGRLEEALSYQKRAVELARHNSLHDLDGEQLSMLALTYLEMGDLDQARARGEAAAEVYQAANMPVEAKNARRRLAQLDNADRKTDGP